MRERRGGRERLVERERRGGERDWVREERGEREIG